MHVGAVGHHDPHRDRERKEELPHRGDHRHVAEFRRIGHQIVTESRPRAGQKGAVDADPDDQHHQHRHQHLVEAFDPLADPARDHRGGDREKDQERDRRLLPRTDEVLEVCRRSGDRPTADRRHRVLVEGRDRFQRQRRDVTGHPAADHRIIGHDDHRHQRVDPAADPQRSQKGGMTAAEFAEGADRSAAGHASETDLRDQQRVAEGKHQHQIGGEKDPAAVLGGEVGETPDVAQSDRRTGGRQNESEFAGKSFASSQFQNTPPVCGERSHLK